MVLSILASFAFLRRHLGRLVGAALLLLAFAFGGINLWAWHHFRAAEAALHENRVEEAQEHIERCLRVWRRGPQTHLLAARIDRAAGRFTEAERHLMECVRLQGGASEQTQLEVLLLRAQSGEIREVEKGLWKCIDEGHADSARILDILAGVYMDEFRWESAGTALTRWLELEPRQARAWHWRGWLMERLQRPEKAIPDYEKAVELEPGRWGARLRLVRLLLQRNMTSSSRRHLEELTRSHGDDPDVQVVQAKMHMLEGKDEEATRQLDSLLQTHPTNYEALFLRSQLASHRVPPRHTEAEEFLRRCLVENPTDLRALYALYQCLEQQGKRKEAAVAKEKHARFEKEIQRLVRLTKFEVERSPYDPEVLCEIGELLLNLSDEESGLKWMERALQHDANHKRTHEVLIRYYQSKGKTEEAEKHRRFLNRLTDSPPSLSARGK
jgi:tetratricopeptide (TPR) repeat protein